MLLTKAIELFIRYMQTIDRSSETIKGYTIELRLFARHLFTIYNGPVYLDEITFADLEGYLHSLKERGKAPASRSRVIYIIRAFYNYCCKMEYVEKNISVRMETVPVPEKERVYLTEKETDTLVAAIDIPIIRIIVHTLFYTGMRISECLNLYISDVNLIESIITVRNTKNKRDRQIPIHKDLLPLLSGYLNNWRNGKENPYFFTVNRKRKVSPDFVNRALHTASARAGLGKHVTCHILRHSFASNLVNRNVNIVNIQKLLGHSDLSTTSIYTHTNLCELKKAINTI